MSFDSFRCLPHATARAGVIHCHQFFASSPSASMLLLCCAGCTLRWFGVTYCTACGCWPATMNGTGYCGSSIWHKATPHCHGCPLQTVLLLQLCSSRRPVLPAACPTRAKTAAVTSLMPAAAAMQHLNGRSKSAWRVALHHAHISAQQPAGAWSLLHSAWVA